MPMCHDWVRHRGHPDSQAVLRLYCKTDYKAGEFLDIRDCYINFKCPVLLLTAPKDKQYMTKAEVRP